EPEQGAGRESQDGGAGQAEGGDQHIQHEETAEYPQGVFSRQLLKGRLLGLQVVQTQILAEIEQEKRRHQRGNQEQEKTFLRCHRHLVGVLNSSFRRWRNSACLRTASSCHSPEKCRSGY